MAMVERSSPWDADFPAAQPPNSASTTTGSGSDDLLEDGDDDYASAETMLNGINIDKYYRQEPKQTTGGETGAPSSAPAEELHHAAVSLSSFNSESLSSFADYETRIQELKNKSSKPHMSDKTCITPENIFDCTEEYREEHSELASLCFEEILLSMLHSQNYYPGPHWLVKPVSDLDVDREDILWRCRLHPETMGVKDVIKIFFNESALRDQL